MSDVNAIINIDINSSSALVNLKRLESQIDQFNRSVSASNATAAASQQGLNKALLDGINNTGLFNARVVPVESSMKRFSNAIDEGRLSLNEYARSAASQMPGLSRVFRKEFDNIEQVASSRVKSMQTQYLALGKTVDGVTKVIASTPTGLAKGMATDLAMTQQRQQIFNKLLDDGSTKLLNWGKNTQWAGRQLMVGFSLPLAAFGAVAAKTFMEIDKATVSLKRVYGDLSTTKAELDSNVEAVKGLGKEYTKYGITLSETISLSARAAATGATNEGLMAATEQTLRFATLGQIEYNQALDTTISLQTAFAISNEDLGKTIDYLNAVENQTILTMEDMSLAIPRVATVVKGLGGSVEDLAIMMTAMREGGVSAENAANGLKSGLASLINPTKRASEGLASMGVNLNSIITQNKGDLMGIITEFGTAINKLDEFSRQQVLEQVFGKYQYARMSALFTNITKDSGQAARAMDIAAMSAADLSKIAEKELGQISDSTSVKFQSAMEQLKISIAPIGEAFLKGITPVVNMISKIADAFNNLPDGVKNAMAVVTAVVAGLGPVFLMTIGLLGNGIANLVKGFQFVRKMLAGIKGDASAFTWLAQGELEATTASKALEGSAVSLTDKLLLQRGAVSGLTAEYERFARAAGLARAEMGSMSGAPVPSGGGRAPVPAPRLRRNTGGTIPGVGSTDTVPAMLTPGEFVINKKSTAQNLPLLHAINDGQNVGGFNKGGQILGVQYFGRMPKPGGKVLPEPKTTTIDPKDTQSPQKTHTTPVPILTNGDSARIPQRILGSARGRVAKRLADVGIPVELLTDAWIMAPFNQKLKKGVKGSRINDWIENLEKLKDTEFGPAYRRAGIKASDLKKELKGSFSSKKTYTQEEFGNIVERAAKEINPRFEPEIDSAYLPKPEVLRKYPEQLKKAGFVFQDSTESDNGRNYIIDINTTDEKEKRQLASSSYPLTRNKGGEIPNTLGGKVTQGKSFYGVVTPRSRQLFEALTAWQTSSRAVRANPEMLGTLMSAMSPLKSRRTLSRGTTLGLTRGSEFSPADEVAIMDALQSGNIDSIIGREFDMRGPISYTAGNTDVAVDAMRQNADVRRIEFLKEQQAEARKRHESNLKRVETLKSRIAKGTGPVDTYKAQLKELEGFISMYPGGQAAMESELKGLASRQYQELLIQQDFMPSSPVINVDRVNPDGTFMGRPLNEGEFLSAGSRVRIKGVGLDEATGVRKLELETIPSDVTSVSVNTRQGNYPGTVGKSGQEIRAEIEQRKALISIMDPKTLLAEGLKSEVSGYELSRIVKTVIEKATDPKERRSILRSIANSRGQEIGDGAWGGYNQELGYPTRSRDASTWREVWNTLKSEGTYIPWKKAVGPQVQSRNLGGSIFESQTKIVPGMGNTDTVPAMLTPGEFVINKEATAQNLPLLHAINDGQVLNRNKGGSIQKFGVGGRTLPSPARNMRPSNPDFFAKGQKYEGFEEVVLDNGLRVLRNLSGDRSSVMLQIGKYIPMHIGHDALLMQGIDAARTSGSDFVLAASGAYGRQSEHAFNPTFKRDFIQEATGLNPNMIRPTGFYKLFEDLKGSGYSHVTVSVGKDREKSYVDMANRAGIAMSARVMERDGVSGTLLRQLAMDGKYEEFSRLIPASVSEKIRREAYDSIREYSPFLKKGQSLDELEFNLGYNKGGQIPRVQYAISGAQIAKLKGGLQPGQLGRYLDENNLRSGLTPEQSQQVLDFDASVSQSLRSAPTRSSTNQSTRSTVDRSRTYRDDPRRVANLNENGVDWRGKDGNLTGDVRPYSEMDMKNILAGFRMQDPDTHRRRFSEWVETTPMRRGDYQLARELENYYIQGFNKGGQIPGMQYFATPNPQRIVQPLSADWRSKLKLKQFPQTYDDFRNTPNILETIYPVLNNPFMSKIAKESAGRRRGITRSIFDYVHNPSQLDEKKIGDSLRWFAQQSPDLPLVIPPESMTYGGNLYRGTGVEDGMFPEEMQRAMGYAASFPKTGINGLQEFIGSPFAVEARSWSKKEKIAERFAYDSKKIKVTLEGSESTPHRGLDIQKMLTDAPFKEGEFIPIDEFGERVVLRIKRVEEQKINNKNKLHVILERATDISDKERKEAISSLEARIVEKRGSVAGKKSRKNKKQQKEEILAMTGVDGAIRDDILSLVDRLNRGERFDSYEKVDEVKHLWQSKEAIEIGRKMYPFYDEIINWGVQKSGKWPYKSGEIRMVGANAGGVMPNTTQTLFRNTGGSIFESQSKIVPGIGSTDTVPAMLTPGEFVINKQSTRENLPLLHAINDGNVNGYAKGGMIPRVQYFGTPMTQRMVQPLSAVDKSIERQIRRQSQILGSKSRQHQTLEELSSPGGYMPKAREVARIMDVDVNMPGYGVDTSSDFTIGTMQGNQAVAAGDIQAVFSTGNTRRQSDRRRLSRFGMSPKKDEMAIYHTGPEIPNHTLLDTPLNTEGNLNNLKGVGTYFTQRRAVSSTYAATGSNAGLSGAEQSQLTQYAAVIKKRDFLNLDAKINGKKQLSLAKKIHKAAEDYYYSIYGTRANIPLSTVMKDVSTMDDLRLSIFNSYKSPKFNSTENSYPVNRSTEAQDSEYHSQMAWVQGVRAVDKKGVLHIGGNIMGDGKKHQVAITYDSVPIREVLSKEEKSKVAELITPNTQLTYESSQSRQQEIRNLESRISSLKNDYTIKRKGDRYESEPVFQPRSSLNAGGTIPGVGNTDKVPAMLTPGEFVINKKATQSNLSLLHAINDGNTPQSMQGFNKGGQIPGIQYFAENEPQRVVQSTGGKYKAPPSYLAETQRIMESGWSSLAAERKAIADMLKAGTISETQAKSYSQGHTSHITSETGPMGGKLWNPKNMQADLGVINTFINSSKKRAELILNEQGNAKVNQIATKTGLNVEVVKKELANFAKGMHATTRESALVLKEMADIHAKSNLSEKRTAEARATRAVLEARLQGDYYKTLQERLYNEKLAAIETVRGRQVGSSLPSVEKDTRTQEEKQQARNKARLESNRETIARIRQEEESKKDQRYKKALSARLGGTLAGATSTDRSAAQAIANEETEDAIKKRRANLNKEAKETYRIKRDLAYKEGIVQSDLKERDARVRQTSENDPEEMEKRRVKALEQKIKRKTDEYKKLGDSEEIAKQKATREVNMQEKERIKKSEARAIKTQQASEPKKAGLFRSGIDAQGNKIPARMTSGVHQASMGLGGGLMMASMAPMMMADQETGKFMGMDPNMAMMGAMGAGTVVSMLPMLGGAAPIVAGFLAAITAAGVGLKIWRDKVDGAAIESAKLGANMGGAANAMEGMANILGVADPAKSRQFTQLGVKPKEAEAFAQYSEMLKGEAGGKFIKEMQSLTSDQRFTKLSDYLKNAIASGMLNKDQAQLFAKAVGATLQDQILSVRAGASITTQQKGTSAVLKIAQQRESTVLENKGIQNVLRAKPGQELNSMDASMTIGAGMQIIKSFSETIAQAEKEYRDGTIKFKEFNDTVITANTSINKWSDAVSVARTQVSQDSLGGFFGEGSAGQAAQTAMDLAGVGEIERKGLEDSYNKMYDLIKTDNAGTQEKGFLEFWGQVLSGKGLDRRYDTKDGEVTIANEGAFKQLETKAQEAGFGGGVEGVQKWASETDPKIIKDAFSAANDYAKNLDLAVKDDALKITMQNLVAAGQDASSVASQANAIFNDPVALKAFNDAGRTVEAFATALEVANSTMLFSSNDFRQKFQDISAKFFTPEYKNAFNAYVSSATTESDRQARVSQIESVGIGSGNAERQMKMDFLDINTTASQYFSPETVQSLLNYTQNGLKPTKTRAYVGSNLVTQEVPGRSGLFDDTRRVSRSYGSYGMGVASPNVMTTEYDNRRLKEFNKTIEGAGKAGLSDNVVKYAIDISTTDGKDPNQVLKNLTENFINLQSLPEEIRLALNIDINDGKDINKFGGDAEAVARGWGMLSALNPNIDLQMAASAVLLDGNGNIIEDTTVIAKNIMKLNKAYETLGKAKGTKGKRKAQIEIAEMYVDEEGKSKINGKEVVANAQKTLDEIGKDLDKLPDTKVNKIIQIQADLEVLNLEKNAQIDSLMEQYQKSTDPKDRAAIRRQIEKLQGEINSSEEDAAAKIKATAIGPNGGGGGGGGSNPLLDFKKSLLEQIRLYADLSMTLKKLFSSKMSFLKLLGSNKGVDDQLRAAGLGEAATQAVMSMGADAAKKWIKANISGGKLKESGKKQEEALLAGAMSQRQSEAVGAIKTANMQQQASTLLASGKYGKAGIETTSAILGDPVQSEGFVKAAKEYDIVQKKVRQAEKKGKSLPSELEKEWKNAQKTLLGYIDKQDKAFSKTNIQEQLRAAKEAAAQQGVMMSVKRSLSASGTSRDVIDAISSDYGKSKALYDFDEAIAKGKNAKGKGAKALREAGRKAAKDRAQLLADTQASLPDTTLEKNIADLQYAQQEINRPLQKQIDLYQEQINLINKEIEALQRLNDSDQNRIRTLTREKEMLERQVEVIARKNEADQKSIDKLQREDELRTRVADALNHELSIMSEKETKIREAYDKRIKALDEVARINDYIIGQQKSQLGLADALSRGDISAAAGIQQDMQTGNAQFATEQMRTGLQTGVDNQIEGLTTSGGLTRVQAEDQIRAIGQQTYQTSLLVRDLQDSIYSRNLDIAAIKIQQRDVDDRILVIQDDIYKRETEIIGIQRDRIQPLQDQITKIQEAKDIQDKNIQNQIDAYQLQIDQRDMADEQAQRVKGLAAQWGSVAEEIAKANKFAKDATETNYTFKPVDPLPGATDAEKAAQKQKMDDWKKVNENIEAQRLATIASLKANGVAASAAISAPVAAAVTAATKPIAGGQGMMFATGGVVGQGGRDSVPSMLTPGEFVMRKASVQKYGAAMLSKMNMGAFDMPRYNVQETGTSAPITSTSNNTSINAPVYNTYSVNVNVPNTNADPSMIADKVIMRIGQIDNANIRSLRGNK